MPTVHFTTSQAASQITRHNDHWGAVLGQAAGPVSYGFRASAPAYNNPEHDQQGTFAVFTAIQKAAVEGIMRLWSNVARISFTEVNAAGTTNNATMLFANYTNANDGAEGFAFLPATNNQTFASAEGDVWMNLAVSGVTQPARGDYHYQALIHEVGHALGLEHPGDYAAAAGVTITYEANAPYIEDSGQYSVMSYFSASKTGADFKGIYASTPLLHDIAAVQRLYGANATFATGDTTYGFNNTGDSAYAIASNSQKVAFSVWDGGGSDTLDFSGYSSNQLIDLTAGTFSDVGGLTGNVSIALGTTVENALGGSGSDRLVGNGVANRLSGGAGDDSFVGGPGNDILDGGSGLNTAIYSAASRNYQLTFRAGNASANVADKTGGDGLDTLAAIQKVAFADTTVDTGWMTRTASLSLQQLTGLAQIYIASFNRAPDALGFDYWGSQHAGGMALSDIAASFFVQPEAAAAYPAGQPTTAFVSQVYGNVLGRSPDNAGLNYWVGQLDSNSVGKNIFLLAVINGATGPDVSTLANKSAVGLHFALTQGLSNGTWGKSVMAGVNGTAASVTAANAQTDGFAASAASATGTELVVQILGIVS